MSTDSVSVDINYYSLSNNISGYNEGGLNPTSAPAPVDGMVLAPNNPLSYASIFKIADNTNVTLNESQAIQGTENALDCNNHITAVLNNVSLGTNSDGLGNQIISLKGGSNLKISGLIYGSGNRLDADILISNWSDQSFSASFIDMRGLKHAAGRNIKIVKRYGASTIISDGNVEILILNSLYLTGYWWLKWIVRKIMGVKLGEKGPSWL